MKPVCLKDVVDHDMAIKCGKDVSDAMARNYRLIETKRGCVMAGVAGASMAMASMAGAFWAGTSRPLDASALDDLWNELIRPLTLSAIDDRAEFDQMVAELSAKSEPEPRP